MVDQAHQVRVHLVTERLCVGSPPAPCVTTVRVAFRGGGVHLELRGSDQARQEVVTELRQEVVTRRLCVLSALKWTEID